MEQVGWVGRKVFLKTFDNKCYQGRVIDESETKLTIIDKFSFKVELSKNDIKLCKEEF